MTLAPHDIVLERSCRLTWFVILGCGTFPAPPSTGSAIKTVSTLKMSSADIVSPLAFSRDTDKFWQEKMFGRNWASETGENFSLSELGGEEGRGHVVSPPYMSHTWAHTCCSCAEVRRYLDVLFFSPLSSKSVSLISKWSKCKWQNSIMVAAITKLKFNLLLIN